MTISFGAVVVFLSYKNVWKMMVRPVGCHTCCSLLYLLSPLLFSWQATAAILHFHLNHDHCKLIGRGGREAHAHRFDNINNGSKLSMKKFNDEDDG